MDMIDSKKTLGTVKLRIPASLHQHLLDKAAEEGVSLNQYCLYCLSRDFTSHEMSSALFNLELAKIKLQKLNFEELCDALVALNEKVMLSYENILRDLQSIQIKKGRESLLEERYPVMFYGETLYLKVPTVKFLIKSAKEDFAKAYEVAAQIVKSCHADIAKVSYGNYDSFSDESGYKKIEDQFCSVVELVAPIDKCMEVAKEIKSKLEKRLGSSYTIEPAPSYLFLTLNKKK